MFKIIEEGSSKKNIFLVAGPKTGGEGQPTKKKITLFPSTNQSDNLISIVSMGLINVCGTFYRMWHKLVKKWY